MTIIEEAAKRLEQLQRAGIQNNPRHGPAREEHTATTSGRLGVQEGDSGSNAQARADEGRRASTVIALRDAGVSHQITLDLAALANGGIVTPEAPRTRTADEFRVIKRPLLANVDAQGQQAIRNGNLIMITSALPGEGKSFTTASLAMSIAMELDRTVLLVDADVTRPSMPELLGFPPARGLLDVLADPSVRLADVLLRTNVNKLSVLCAGSAHARTTELLASDAMDALLDEIAQRYPDRIVVFDSPPLLVTTEARVLASHMGQVVLVIEADKTPQSAVRHALATLDQCSTKLMLLNKARRRMQDSHGYRYGYGS